MTIRTVHSGGPAVRWAYGVFLTLCVALAVLVHHETSATGLSSMPSMAHATHVMPDETAPAVSDDSSRSADANGGCSMPGTQHCTTASVGSVQLALPAQVTFDQSAHLRQAAAGRAPGATVGRAPPDLSVLSQLRI
ncbi:DUF6153 family protein [Streptomyces sp. NPDC050619]|uniref:DUF6153 family protein n=1 Tax=Streptomyces sp. NPDC050619 TaxID=3157214 RepID=UPI003419B496